MKYRWKILRVEELASYYCTIFQMRNIQGKNIDSENDTMWNNILFAMKRIKLYIMYYNET